MMLGKKGKLFLSSFAFKFDFSAPAQLLLVDISSVQFFIWDYYNKADQGREEINKSGIFNFFCLETFVIFYFSI